MRIIFLLLILIVVFEGIYLLVFKFYLAPPGDSPETKVFVVSKTDIEAVISENLQQEGYIKNSLAFDLINDVVKPGHEIKPGGYKLRKNMNTWEVFDKITAPPDLAWVTIDFCARKEQVGEIVAESLGWDQDNLNKWNEINKIENTDYYEGVYYPDTYLIPKDETEYQVAQRFINRFNEKTKPLSGQMLEKNIKWSTAVNIASLIEREAGGISDMRIISGVIWNRLNIDMRLQIDATMQYTHGKRDDGTWWGPISIAEKRKDSPYNTYRREGLPPTPICSPGIEAIDAAINPENTECLYYLHDALQNIHCAKTYTEHQQNIETYLRY